MRIKKPVLLLGYSIPQQQNQTRIIHFFLDRFSAGFLEVKVSPIAASTTDRAGRLTSVEFFFFGKASGSPGDHSVLLGLRVSVFVFAFFAMPASRHS